MEPLKRSGMRPLSALKLWSQRSLSGGGWAQFIVPFVLSVLSWLVLTALLALLLGTGKVTWQGLGPLKNDLTGHNLWSISFFHLFTNGGQDLMAEGPGWLFVLWGTVLIALLTAVFTNFFDKAAADYLEGRSDYKVNDHIAVFGWEEYTPDLIRQMTQDRYKDCIFLILCSIEVPQARRKLASALSKRQMSKVILLDGTADSVQALPRMQVERAQEIHIFGSSVSAMECLRLVASEVPDGQRKPCYIMLEDRTATAALKASDLGRSMHGKFSFFPMYRHEMWAHKVFINRSLAPNPKGFLPLEGTEGIGPDSADHVHLAVVGINPAGIALAAEAAHLGHFPNAIGHPEYRTRISFIDPDAENGMYRLMARFPGLFSVVRRRLTVPGESPLDAAQWQIPSGTAHLGGEFTDMEVEFIQADVNNPAVRDYLCAAATDSHTRFTVALCSEDGPKALSQAANLPVQVLDGAIQILVNQPECSSVADVVATSTTGGAMRFGRIRAFGMHSRAYDLDLITEIVDAARSWRKDSAGDPAKNASSKSEAARMWSNIYNAAHIWTKLRSAGSTDGTIPQEMIAPLAMTEHNRWNAEQLLMGFRPLTSEEQKEVLDAGEGFLEVKNRLKREHMAHLDICSWKRLSEIDPEVLQYDFNFVEQI